MESSTTTIECTRDVADEIADDLGRLVDGDIARADKNNLGGLQTVLLVVQTVSPIVTTLLPLLIAHLQNSKIARLKFKKADGTEVEITNPTKEQLEKYI